MKAIPIGEILFRGQLKTNKSCSELQLGKNPRSDTRLEIDTLLNIQRDLSRMVMIMVGEERETGRVMMIDDENGLRGSHSYKVPYTARARGAHLLPSASRQLPPRTSCANSLTDGGNDGCQ